MKIHKNIEQWTQERFDIRKLKMTASHAAAIGNCWKWLDTYILELITEYVSTWEKKHFSNEHTDRWNELEPIARNLYEMTTWNIVDEVWFIEYEENIWCSPDGLVWDDGWIEIKCLDDKKHFEMILEWEKVIESWYIWQIQMNLLITWRKWRDYIWYNPNFKDSLLIYRIYPDETKFEKLKMWFEIWKTKIKELLYKYEQRWQDKKNLIN